MTPCVWPLSRPQPSLLKTPQFKVPCVAFTESIAQKFDTIGPEFLTPFKFRQDLLIPAMSGRGPVREPFRLLPLLRLYSRFWSFRSSQIAGDFGPKTRKYVSPKPLRSRDLFLFSISSDWHAAIGGGSPKLPILRRPCD